METIEIFTAVVLINIIAYLISKGQKKAKKKPFVRFQANQRMYLSYADMHSHRTAGL